MLTLPFALILAFPITISAACCAVKTMAPFSLSLHNLREIVKLMLLVENDLSSSVARCDECIRRRFLLMEALAEEIMSSTTRWQSVATETAISIRRWQLAFSDNVNRQVLIGRIAKKRDTLVTLVFDQVCL